MEEKLEIILSEKTGFPMIQVSPDDIWHLVEYLSWRRVRVTYTFEGTHFAVQFQNMEVSNVGKLLDDWLRLRNANAMAHPTSDTYSGWSVGTSSQ